MKDFDFLSILFAKQERDYDKLNEASLSKAYQELEAGDGFAILTSWDPKKNKKENLALFEKLKSEILSLGYGFVKLRGHWKKREINTIPYGKRSNDKIVDYIEPLLFIPKITLKEIEHLIKKYNQEVAIYGGQEINKNIALIYKNGKQDIIGKFDPVKIAQAYSKIRGESFIFKGFEYIAQSWIQSVIEMHHNLKRIKKY